MIMITIGGRQQLTSVILHIDKVVGAAAAAAATTAAVAADIAEHIALPFAKS